MNKWKLSTIVLASVLAGFLLAQVSDVGFVSAQSGGITKVQIDTSNCTYGSGPDYKVPDGAVIFSVGETRFGTPIYSYNVCR